MLVLAPMQGLTGLPFRKAFYRTFGDVFDYAVSPFISLTHGNLTLADKKIHDVLPENNRGLMPVVPQVLGSEIPEFVDLANRLYDIGYTEINWNIGCPMPRVARKIRGSGILQHPSKVDEVLEAVTTKTKVEVSVKMRLGYRSENEIFDLIPILNKYPLKNVIIHPRTGVELYSSQLHIESLKRTLPLIKHKVIYNGEIKTTLDAEYVKEHIGDFSGIMIGRGVLFDPLLPLRLKNCNVTDENRLLHSFLDNLCDEIGQLHIPDKSKANKLKEYWSFLNSNPNIKTNADPLHCKTFAETHEAVSKCLLSIENQSIK